MSAESHSEGWLHGEAAEHKTTMACTVKKLAKISGVSIRTLHFYDEVGLLKPSFVGANGYRFYEEAQLLTLQQILFYRELGFELKEIKRVMGRKDFEKLDALRSHRKALLDKRAHVDELIVTIDKTIERLKGNQKMKINELFIGFSPEQQAKHEDYLVNRFGDEAKASITESKQRVKNWKKSDWQKSGAEFNQICAEMVTALRAKESSDSSTTQALIRRHFTWLKQFWTPNRESYIGHAAMIRDSDLRKAYEAHHPELPDYMATAMATFAENDL